METEYLFKFLSLIHPLSNELKVKLQSVLVEEHYKSKRIILNVGQISNRAWFIQEGSAMAYIYKDGKRVPYWFWNKHEMLVSIKSFFKQLPADGYIELLEDSTLLSASYEVVHELFKIFPESNIIARTVIENYENNSVKRILEYTTMTPLERYKHLVDECPFIVQKASVEAIATYLGISRKTLNRIRAKVL